MTPIICVVGKPNSGISKFIDDADLIIAGGYKDSDKQKIAVITSIEDLSVINSTPKVSKLRFEDFVLELKNQFLRCE